MAAAPCSAPVTMCMAKSPAMAMPWPGGGSGVTTG
jgi:hypothetical protein